MGYADKTTHLFTGNKSCSQMNLAVEIQSALIGNDGYAAVSLRAAFGHRPNATIISTVQDMIQDNEPAMLGMLGEGLCNKIKMFEI